MLVWSQLLALDFNANTSKRSERSDLTEKKVTLNPREPIQTYIGLAIVGPALLQLCFFFLGVVVLSMLVNSSNLQMSCAAEDTKLYLSERIQSAEMMMEMLLHRRMIMDQLL